MDRGLVEQVATPRELYERPATAFVAGFIGVSNIIHLRADRRENGYAVMQLGEGERILAPLANGAEEDAVVMTVRPEKVKFADVGDPQSRVSATITDVIYVGSMTQYVVELPTGDRLVVHRLNDEARGRPVAVGDRVMLHWAAEHSFVIPQGEERAGAGPAAEAEEVEAAP
jgi:spermidine/putrescine transport system ATP-binding protein